MYRQKNAGAQTPGGPRTSLLGLAALSICLALFGHGPGLAIEKPKENSSEKPAADRPITKYCQKLQKQLQNKWKSTPGYEINKILDLRIDQTGKIVEVKRGEPAVDSILLGLKKIKDPPVDAKKELWLAACLSNDTDKITVTKRDVDWGPYMANLQKSIKHNWYPPKGNETKRVQVTFKIHEDGTMSDFKLSKESGVPAADEAAQRAITMTTFQPLPDGAGDIDIQFTFDYNIFQKAKEKFVAQ